MHEKMKLVKLLMITVIIGLFTPLCAQSRTIQLSARPTGLNLHNSNEYGFDLRYTVDKYDLHSIDTKAGTFDRIVIEGFGYSTRIGEAELPAASRIVAVPLGAEVSFEIRHQEKKLLTRHENGIIRELLPSQEPVSKSADYNNIVFAKDTYYYTRSALSQNPTFRIEEIGMMRGMRLFQFYIEPVRYNPGTGDVEIVYEADIRIDFSHPDLAASAVLKAKTASAEFEALYAKTIMNYSSDDRSSLVRTPTKMLILCPPAYTSTMESYISFKRKQGYIVNLVTVGSGGTVANTTSAITNYMQNVWNSATSDDPAPTYLIIVGDTSLSGNNIIAPTGVTASHPTDLTYVRLNGTDYLPEMYFGRFSVTNTTELTNVINKTLMFARTSMPDRSYLGKTVLIAGVDSNYAPTHGNGAISYGAEHYFNGNHGITSNNYPYPASGSSASAIIANANEGRGYMNYTAHGSTTSWADPTFTVSNMLALTNVNKPFVAVGNCCVTNQFTTSQCFGESVIRANNAGAAYIGGTNNTYWDEDYYWAVGYRTTIDGNSSPYDPTRLGAYDAMFHAPSSVNDWAQTTGETVFMGNMAVQQSGSSRTNYYWEIYSIMGDPSLMPYYGVPTVNTATFPSTIMMGLSSINVTAQPYSKVALSMNGTLYATGIVPASGPLTLSFTPFTTVGNADLVITCSGKITREEIIQVLPASGPYMTVDNNVYTDNNNHQPDCNESGSFNTTFKNAGANSATNITATLSCSTAGITITDATETITSLAAGASITRNNAFSFTTANNVPDGTTAAFTITMISGTNNWQHNFPLVINAPALSFGNLTISDPSGNSNGRLDPGESVTVSIPLINDGGAASLSGTANLSCSTPGITINTGSASFSAIAADGSTSVSFSLSASASMSVGTVVNLAFSAVAGAYNVSTNQVVPVGLILEDFESGDFSGFEWQMEDSLPWLIDSATAYEGSYSAKSGTISHSQSSTIKINRQLSSPGTLSFRYKVSSESGWDYLKFYVDGEQQGQFSGSVDWTEATYQLAAGTREIKWTYSKDGSVNGGSDCAWIDYVVFPASTVPTILYPPQDLTAIPANGRVTLSWEAPISGNPSSYQIYRNGSLLTSVSVLSYQDNAVTNGVTYSYYVVAVYPEGSSDPSNTVNVVPDNYTAVVIGTGTGITGTQTASPVNVYYQSLHGQSVYTATELNSVGLTGPATIHQIGFNITNLPSLSMPDFSIRMAHTSSQNVASWISSDLQTVYTAESYSPTQTGWNMYTLSTPFVWNGTDNILVDTAFGLIGSYTSTGQIEYTETINGYRYSRSDSSDQTQVFSGGSSSTSRPNLKIAFDAVVEEQAMIAVDPGSLIYSATMVGTTATQTLRVSNSGTIALTGSISTPTAFSIAQSREDASSKNQRNSITFTVAAGGYRDYTVSFSPITAGNFNGNIMITSNAENYPIMTVSTRGSSYLPPTISINSGGLSASLLIGEEGTDSFNITNNGGAELNYSIAISNPRTTGSVLRSVNQERSIAGSYLSMDPQTYTPGTTMDWDITVYNASIDTEWIKEVILTFPEGFGITFADSLICNNGTMAPTIDGTTITWFGETSAGYGIIRGLETVTAALSVRIPAGFSGDLSVPYTLNGDIYNSEPHSLSDTFVLSMDQPLVEWLSLSSYSGTLAAGASDQITASFSALGMNEGLYNAMLQISSNDPAHPTTNLEATMEVFDVSNHPPVINLPDSYTLDRNTILTVGLSSYISDPEGDAISLQVLGNTNVLCSVDGLRLTLSSVPNWVGSETITIVASDGELSSSDQIVVNILPVNTPNWTIVNYPNNPATIYAVVNINGYPAANNDLIAAFVGNECRGSANIVIGRDNAYATIIVQLAQPDELVYFRVYSQGTDTVYDADTSVQPDFGEEIGQDDPIVVDAEPLTALPAPEVSIAMVQGTYTLSWNSVLHANRYEVYASDTPDGTYQLIQSTSARSYQINNSYSRRFFRVKAVKDSFAK